MTRDQERARARRRHDKVQAARAVRQERAARLRRILAVVAVVAVVLAMVVGVSLAMRTPDSSPPPAAAPSGSSGPSDAATTPGAVAGCSTPPAPQARPKTFGTVPDKTLAAGRTWVATITTNCGDVVVELDGKAAPQTVASFIQLAREGYWAPSPCHRLTTDGIYVLQCGDPTGTGSGNPGYGYGIEHAPQDGRYPTGTLAMARTDDPNSNGGQFFIVHRDTQLPTDGGGYSIFGKVTSGLDMVDRIAATGTDDSNGPGDGHPKTAISILKVSVTEKKA